MKKTKAIIITISLVTMGTVGLIGAYFMNRTKDYANAESKEIYNETETDTETIEAKTEKDNKDDNKSDQVGKADKKKKTETEIEKKKDDIIQITTETETEIETERKNVESSTAKTYNTASNDSETASHQHTWVYVVDCEAYDEDIYEERPVYEEQPVYEYKHNPNLDIAVDRWADCEQTRACGLAGHEDYSYPDGNGHWDNSEHEASMDLFANVLNCNRACACAYYSCRWICPSDGSCYTKIQVGTETVQVGTEKVKVGTKHHDEEGHWECSCGAIK